ncbi:MAG: NnrU family protein, partial [Burkholderiaceae bacterium]
MTWLIAGLLIFLGVHSIRIFDEALRTRLVERWGEKPWKGIYSLLSVLGFVVLIYGYGQARMQPIPLYELPLGFRHASSLLVWFAMILVIAAYVPGNWFKTRLRHPMVLGVKLWAFAHLLSNGTAADVLLFGGFLLVAIASFRAARKRDKEAASTFPEPTPEVGLSRPRSMASATVI